MSAVAITTCGNCGSGHLELRRKVASNGLLMIAYQCMTCGRAASPWLKKATVPNADTLAQWDQSVLDRYQEMQRKQWEQRAEGIRAAAAEHDAKWWDEYNQYLRTSAWRSLRSRVLQRAGGWCEGCRQTEATQVHHLTYAHVRAEFLWELVAICDDCHDRFHAHGMER